MRRLTVTVVGIAFVLTIAAAALAAGNRTSSGFGTLTAFEDRYSTAIIDDKGYIMSGRALIYDKLGKKVSANELELPAPVYIEFVYGPGGVIITLLKVRPE